MTVERTLICGETSIVHVPVARALAMQHTAHKQRWDALSVRRLAHAGQRPTTHGFEHHPIVPAGHVAIQIIWHQKSRNDRLGVPRAFHEEADQEYKKARLLWYAIAIAQTIIHKQKAGTLLSL